MWVEIVEVNDALSLLLGRDDQVVGVMNLAGDGTRIGEIRTVWNPEKLQHLQPLDSDLTSAST